MVNRSRKKVGYSSESGEEQTDNSSRPELQTDLRNMPVKKDVDVVSMAVQNILVLKEITSFLSLSDLKQFRLVSRQWNQESLQFIRNRVCCLVLDNENKKTSTIVRRFLQREKKWDKETDTKFDQELHGEMLLPYWKNLLKLVKTSNAGFPCTKFGFNTELLENNHELFFDFLETVSSFATELELIVRMKDVFIDVYHIEFPFLRALKMSQKYVFSAEIEEMLKCFVYVINNAPLLDEIHLKVSNDTYETNEAGEFLKAVKTSPIRGQIRAFGFETEMRDEYLVILNEMSWRLEKLSLGFHFDYDGDALTQEPVEIFLKSQCETLKELTIENHDSNYTWFLVGLPCMRKLTVLSLHLTNEDLPKLSFSRDLPALKRLVFKDESHGTYRYTNLLNKTTEPLETVTDLVIPVPLDSFGPYAAINEAFRIFPKLRKLEVDGARKFRRTVGNKLKHLQELTIHPGDTPMSYGPRQAFFKMLTGYSQKELKNIWEIWAKSSELQTETHKRPLEFFQKLKVLRIDEFVFTDVHCLLGPMRLRSLKCLDMRQSTYSRVSQRVLDQMREKFEVLIEDDCVVTNAQNADFSIQSVFDND